MIKEAEPNMPVTKGIEVICSFDYEEVLSVRIDGHRNRFVIDKSLHDWSNGKVHESVIAISRRSLNTKEMPAYVHMSALAGEIMQILDLLDGMEPMSNEGVLDWAESQIRGLGVAVIDR